MRKILFFAALFLLLSASGFAANRKIVVSLEGTFTDATTGLITGTKKVQISLNNNVDLFRNDLGAVLWKETLDGVKFDKGFMSVELGQLDSNPLKSSYFDLENPSFVVEIEGLPGKVNLPLRYVPYAAQSDVAKVALSVSANTLSGTVGSAALTGNYPGITGLGALATTLNLQSDLALKSNVFFVDGRKRMIGVGTSAPQYMMDVRGTVNATEFMVNGVPLSKRASFWEKSGAGLTFIGSNVGIGTAAPQQLLHVAGNAFVSGSIQASSLRLGSVVLSQGQLPGNWAFNLGNLNQIGIVNANLVRAEHVTANSLRIGSVTVTSGNITGLGTISGDKLIVKSLQVGDQAQSGSAIAIGDLRIEGSKLSGIGDLTVNRLFTGGIGIGITTPVTALDVNGGIRIGDIGAAPQAGMIRWTGSNFQGYDGIGWRALDIQATSGGGWTEDSTTNVVFPSDFGRFVGIATLRPQARLHVAGHTIVSGNLTLQNDLKFKSHSISDGAMTGDWDFGGGKFKNLGVVTANRISDGTLQISGGTISGLQNLSVPGSVSLGTATLSGSLQGTTGAFLSATVANDAQVGRIGINGNATIAGSMGIGLTNPVEKVQIKGGNVVMEGFLGTTVNVGAIPVLTAAGGGTKLIWYPKKAAFRAGHVAGNQWDDGNIGTYSVAFGRDTIAGGYASSVLGGISNSAGGDYSVAVGRNMQLNSAAARSFVWGYSETNPVTIDQADAFLIYPNAEGKVGIGLSHPAALLDVAGTANARSMTTGLLTAQKVRIEGNLVVVGQAQFVQGLTATFNSIQVSGTVNAGAFVGRGTGLTQLDASQITLGQISDARLSSQVTKLGQIIPVSGISGLGPFATQNSIAVSKVIGLGVLATHNIIANSDLAGGIAVSKITGLGLLATRNTITNSQLVPGAYGNITGVGTLSNVTANVYWGDGSKLTGVLATNAARLNGFDTASGFVAAPRIYVSGADGFLPTAVNSASIVDGSIVDADISNSAGIAISKISGLGALATQNSVSVSLGGTGRTGLAAGTVLVGNGTLPVNLVAGTSGQYLKMGSDGIPVFEAITFSGSISGTVTIAQGGTGATTAAGARTNLGLGTLSTRNVITESDISGSISNSRISGLGSLAVLSTITSSEITDGTIANTDIANDTITNAKIASAAAIDWAKLSKTGSSLADLTTRSAADLSSGTLPSARLSGGYAGITGVGTLINVTANVYWGDGSKLTGVSATDAQLVDGYDTATNFLAGQRIYVSASDGYLPTVVNSNAIVDGSIVNADINSSAAIDWMKVNKTGSSLADLTTRSATDLTSGTIPSGRLAGSYTGITGLGTITTGVWNGTTIAIADGGTGATSAASARTNLGLGSLSTLNTITTAEITDGTIANADIASNAAISYLKIAGLGALATRNVIANSDVASNAAISFTKIAGLGALATKNIVDSSLISDGTIVNTDISASASIDWTKINKSGSDLSDIGGTVAVGKGGSGRTTLSSGSVLVGSGASPVNLVGGTSGQFLKVGNDGIPVFAAISFGDSVGTAIVSQGGTGVAAITANAIVIGSGTSPIRTIVAGSANQALIQGGSGPQFGTLDLANSTTFSGISPLTRGGTGALDAAGARTNLGLGSLAVLSLITTSEITDGTIANADIAPNAAIAISKITGLGVLATRNAISNVEVASGAAIDWEKLSKTGSSLADLTTRSAADLSSGTLPTGRLSGAYAGITGVGTLINVTANVYWGDGSKLTGVTAVDTQLLDGFDTATGFTAAQRIYASGSDGYLPTVVNSSSILDGSIVNADINSSAAIGWGKIDKSGSSLADLTTRSAGDLTSGTLNSARLAGSYTGITGLGTITVGTWDATPILVAKISGLGVLATRNAVDSVLITDGAIVNADIASNAAISYLKIAGLGVLATRNAITNAEVASGAAIDWAKLSKTGSSLADLSTRSAGDLSSGTLPAARLSGSYTGITGLGTITTGAWQGTEVAVANGGTGATSASAARTNLGLGSLATLSAITGSEITDGTIGNADISANASIAWTKINKSGSDLSDIGGTLAVGKGGSGRTTLTLGNVLVGNGTSPVTLVGGTSGQFLKVGSDGIPVFEALTFSGSISGTLTVNQGGTGVATITANQLVVGSGASPIRTVVSGSNDQVLVQTSSGPQFATLDLANGTTFSGISPLVRGGTGASTATGARTNLGLGSLAVLNTITTSEITDGTIANADIASNAAIAVSKIAGLGVLATRNAITNAEVASGAAIDWTKISKTGSSLAELTTRSAGDLNSGTLNSARLSGSYTGITGVGTLTAGTWDATPIAVAKITGLGVLATRNVVDSGLLTDGTIVNADIASNAAIAISKITGLGILATRNAITNAEVASGAAIDWAKISKTGSSLADLTTRSAADLSSGTLPAGRLSGAYSGITGVGTLINATANVYWGDGSKLTGVVAANSQLLDGYDTATGFVAAQRIYVSGSDGFLPAVVNSASILDSSIVNADIASNAGIVVSKLSGLGVLATQNTVTSALITDGTIVNADINNAASIDWTKINKTGSSLADLTTRLISDTTGTLAVARGGTGRAALVTGSVLVGSGTSVVNLVGGTSGQFLKVGGDGIPVFAAISFGDSVGTAIVSQGGTGVTAITANAIVIGSGTSPIRTVVAGSTNHVLTQGGSGPQFGTLDLANGTTFSGISPVVRGGTGASDASGARTNLGLGSLAVLSTITTSEITDGTIANVDIASNAAITVAKIAGLGVLATRNAITNAEVASGAAIDWAKVSKTGSSLADLSTRSAGDLSSGTLLTGRLSGAYVGITGVGTLINATANVYWGDGSKLTGVVAANSQLLDGYDTATGFVAAQRIYVSGSDGFLPAVVNSASILDSSIVNADIASNAGIVVSKLSGLGVLATQNTITSALITDGAIVNADINSAAAIDWAKINKSGSSLADLTTRLISDTTGTLAVARGGTGRAALVTGSVLVGSGTSVVNLVGGTSGQFLKVGGDGIPVFAAISFGDSVGTAIVSQGGTGVTAITANAIVIGSGTSPIRTVVAGSTNQALIQGGSGPQFGTLDLANGTTFSGISPVVRGGTGASDASGARTNLGLGSLAVLNTITTSEITDGTIANADIASNAAIAVSKIAGLGVLATRNAITNAEVASGAAIDWAKLSKTGSSLADLTTRSAADLSSGTLPNGRLSGAYAGITGVGTLINATANVYWGDGSKLTGVVAANSQLLDGYDTATGFVAASRIYVSGADGYLPTVVNSNSILDGSIVNADIASNAGITVSKLSGLGVLATQNTITSALITDGAIVNADINSAAAIDWAKINKSGSSLADLTTRLISDTTGTLAVARGGTGRAALVTGSVLVGSGTSVVNLVGGTSGQFLKVGGDGIPVFAAISFGDSVGTAIVSQGGTGVTAITANAIVIGSGTSPIRTVVAGSTNQALIQGGSGPQFGTLDLANSTTFSGISPLTRGGTGALDAAGARTNLGLGSLAVLSTIATSEITDGTIANVDIASNAAITVAKIAGLGVLATRNAITNAEVASGAAIDWAKVSKTGSSLADLSTRSAGDLSSGTLLTGRLSGAYVGITGVGTLINPTANFYWGDGSKLTNVSATLMNGFTTATAFTAAQRIYVSTSGGYLPSGTVDTGSIKDFTIDNNDISTSAGISTNKLSGSVFSISGHGLGSLASLSTITSSEITDDTITNADINASAGILVSKIAGLGVLATRNIVTSVLIQDGSILDADVSANAAIGWTKLSKTGSSLADLTTRSATDLTSGTLPTGRLTGSYTGITGVGTLTAGVWDATPIALAKIAGLGVLATRNVVDSGLITDGTIINADIASNAAISYLKIVGLGVLATQNAVTSTLITDGTIVNADIAANAAIAYTKIAGLGVLATQNAVTSALIVDGTIASADIGVNQIKNGHVLAATIPISKFINDSGYLTGSGGGAFSGLIRSTVASYNYFTGNLGIGTTTPLTQLQVSGNARISGLSAGGFVKATNGTGALTVGQVNATDIQSAAALTKTDDTNVTLTLGGSPSTALLSATSLTLGWAGQLPVSRGGTNASAYTAGSVVFAGSGGTSLTQDNSNLFWDNTNKRLGIATASPGAKLDISDTVQNAARIVLSGQEFYQASNSQTSGLAFLLGVNRTNNKQLWIADSSALAQNTTNGIFRIVPGSVGSTSRMDAIATDGLTYLPFHLGGSTFALLPVGGNVGVGTTAPASFFSVGSTSQFQVNSTGAIVAATGLTSSGTITFSSLTAGSVPFAGSGGLVSQDNAKLFWDNTNKYLGVGLNSPLAPLHVKGNAGVLNLEGTDHAYIQWYPYGQVGRKAYTGFPGASSTIFSIANEVPGGHIILSPTATGNVGIGTAAPATRLHVIGNATISGLGSGVVHANGSGLLSSSLVVSADIAANVPISKFVNDSSFITAAGTVTGLVQSTASGTNYFTGGNLGVGLNNPQSKLAVAGGPIAQADFADGDKFLLLGATTATKIAHNTGWLFSSYSGSTTAANTGSFNWFVVDGASTFVERMRLTNAGRLGVGITNPGAVAHLVSNGGTGGTLLLQMDSNDTWQSAIGLSNSSTNGRAYSFLLGGQNNTLVGAGGLGLYDSTAGSVRLILKPDGNVGIGTTSPSTQLHVSGNARISALGSGVVHSSGTGVLSSSTVVSADIGVAQIKNGHLASGIPISKFTNDSSFITAASTHTGLVQSTLTSGMNYFTSVGTSPGTGTLKLVSSTGGAGDRWWLGFGHGGVVTDANDRARVGVDILSGGSGRLFFTTGAEGAQAERMRIDENGNVGIGITNPATKLEIVGNVKASNLYRNVLASAPLSTAGWYRIAQGIGDLSGDFELRWVAGNGSRHGYLRFLAGLNYSDQSHGITILNNSRYGADGVQKLRLIQKGDGDSQFLEFYFDGDLVSSSPITFTLYQYDGQGWDLVNYTAGSVDSGYTAYEIPANMAFAVLGTAANATVITKVGNLGIGTTTPGFPLGFANSLGDKISLYGQSGAHYGFGVQNALFQIHSDVSAADIAFGYGSSGSFTERVRIKGNGNVGIGTTSPAQALHVETNNNNGIYIRSTGSDFANALLGFQNVTTAPAKTNNASIMLKSGTDRSLQFFNSTTGLAGTDVVYKFLDNTTAVIVAITSSGNVGIGTTSPASSLHVKTSGANALQYAHMVNNPNATDTGGTATGILLSTEPNNFGKGAIVYERRASFGRGNLYILQNSVADGTNPTLAQAAVTVQNDGNVGIGITNPASKLVVNGGNLAVYSGTLSVSSSGESNFVDGNTYLYIQPVTNSRVRLGVWDNVVGGTRPLSLQEAGGNVGIGSSLAPSEKLQVFNGNIIVSNNVSVYKTGLLGTGSSYGALIFRKDGVRHAGFKWDGSKLILQNASNNHINPDSWATSDAQTAMTWDIANGGNVGIGTTAPGAPLHVGFSTGGETLRLQTSSNNPFLSFYGASARIGYIQAISGSYIGFSSDSSSVPIILSAGGGNVGIGMTSPSARLQIATPASGDGYNGNSLRISSRAEPDGYFLNLASFVIGAGDVNWVFNQTNNGSNISNVLSFWGGKVGIGTSQANYKLEVNGDINAIGSVRSNGTALSSDKRLKKDIQPLLHPLQTVMSLRGVSYLWRRDEFAQRNLPAGRHIGVIAQELENVLPDAVDTGHDGFKAVSYAELTPLLIEAVKEMKTELDGKQKQIDLLMRRIEVLENKK